MDRPITTLFSLVSVDGKITSGDSDELDPDRDWKKIVGVREGRCQYDDLEKQTDLYSLNSGRVMAKIGVNERAIPPTSTPATFVIIDNKPHLTESGVKYMLNWGKALILATVNPDHPAFSLTSDYKDDLAVLFFESEFSLKELLFQLKSGFGVDRLTIQSGGELNSAFIRQGLIDRLSLVLAPLLVGGRDTPTLVDGESLHSVQELSKLKALKLISCRQLQSSYLHLEYEVISETRLL